MITQYTGGYSTIPSQVVNVVANKVSLLDQYVIIQTGQYEFTALVKNMASKECKQYVFTRSSSNYNSYYTVSSTTGDFDYDITNEYYVYSNVGVGQSADLPAVEGVTAYGVCIISCALMFSIIFKGVLFKCLNWHKR